MEVPNESSLSSHEERHLPPLPSELEALSDSLGHQSSDQSDKELQLSRDFSMNATATRTPRVSHVREFRHINTSFTPRGEVSPSTVRDVASDQSISESMTGRFSRAPSKHDKNTSRNIETYYEDGQRQGYGLITTNENIVSDMHRNPLLISSQSSGSPSGDMANDHSFKNLPRTSHRPPTPSLPETSNQLGVTLERRDFEIPRWQLDAEVTYCPICKSQFNFFVRKHHCRKCGRVVCNSCSPHRITIPYQYIILPPDTGNTILLAPTAQNRFQNLAKDPEYGGGERVRLCNPCVPDPNNTPTRTIEEIDDHHRRNSHILHSRSTSTLTQVSHAPGSFQGLSEILGSTAADDSRRPRQYNYLTHRSRNSRASNPSFSTLYNRQERGYRPENSASRSRSNTIGTFSNENFCGGLYHSLGDDSAQNSRTMLRPGHSRRSLPQSSHPPRRQIAEDDECWVCHEELPSKNLENYEVLRAAHVNSCIKAATASTSGPTRNTSGSMTGNINESFSDENSSQQFGQSRYLLPAQRKHIGIFSYRATEKDKIDNAECTICLEDFEAGQDMGRLECFCRFHLKCIRGWFEKRPGQCPVHQHDRSY